MTEKTYNNKNKTSIAVSYFLSRLMQHAKRLKKYSFFLLRKRYNPLWWAVPNSFILQKTQTEKIFTNIHKILSSESKISNSRIYTSIDLHNNRWNRAYRKHQIFGQQWDNKKDSWSSQPARSYSYKAFSLPSVSESNKTNSSSSQLAPEKNILHFA